MDQSRDAILRARYMHGTETEHRMWRRVARQWATDGEQYRNFLRIFSELKALPNTPAIANAGLPNPMGSACFVLPVEDDTDAILDTLRAATIIHKYGGGTGFDFSAIRSRGTTVSSTGRSAPGPVGGPLAGYSEWLGRWSQAGLRSGANMGMLDVSHPDIMDFIRAKRGTESFLTNFNLSVKVTDEFMARAADGTAGAVWDEIVDGAWANGEPGVFFDDTTNDARLHPERIVATNPCGEVPLRSYEACVLGSINLAAHLISRGGRRFLDEPSFRETAHWMTILLDNIIELQYYPLEEIEREQKRYRKIGLGVMGLADALADMGIVYGSDRSIAAAQDWGRILQEQSYATSRDRGFALGFYSGHGAVEGWDYPDRRNLNTGVIAPTGSISRLAQCSFGIEPHFDVDSAGDYMSFVVGGAFKDHQPRYLRSAFTPSSRISLTNHLRMQAVWQEHMDQAVSKTVNCPFETTRDEVERAIIYAWKQGCKGTTILREGSRENVVIGATEGDCNGAACAI